MAAEAHVHTEEELLAYEEVLEEYRRRQMLEHLTGPMISLVLHVVVIVACVILLAGKEIVETASIEFDVKQMHVEPLEAEILEQLDNIEEEIIEEMVPTVERPTITPESVSVEATSDFAEAMATTEMDMDFTSLLDVKTTTSPLQLAGLYANRTAEGREKALRTYAGRGGEFAERAVMKALIWLRDRQQPDGSWSPRGEPGAMTGLAVLAFLAHGETPVSEEFGTTVQKGITWLTNHVMQAKYAHGRGYGHGIITYALSEAYGLTKLPMIKPPMEKGLTMIVKGQQPQGGYDYNYAKGERWDLSVAAWQMQAMKAGYVAGANVEGLEKAIEKGISFTKNIAYKNGRFGYSSPGSGSWGMTAAGCLVLQLCGDGDSVEAKNGVKNLSELAPEWKANQMGHGACYGWYYTTQALFHGGRTTFRNWNAKFAPMLIANQDPDGHWDAPPADDHSANAAYAPYYNTCMNALSLMVYYRYLPTYQEPTKRVQSTDVFDL